MIKRNFSCSLSVLVIVALLIGAPVVVHGAGFSIVEQSVRGLGTAYAGAESIAEDPSTIFYNPAGLTHLEGKQFEMGINYIAPKAEFDDKGSTHVTGASLNTSGDNHFKGGIGALVPNLYYSHSLSQDLKLGLGITAPFGLKTEYKKNWVGRYHGLESSLETININPAIAYRINPMLSVGGGVSVQQADATLTNMIDFGTIFAGALGTTPQGADGFARLEGDDWGYGFNLGLMFEPAPTTRFGLTFRSEISHTLEGDVKFAYPNATVAAASASPGVRLVNTDVTADLDLPATVSLSAYHELNSQWAIMASVLWTNWSSFDELRIKFDSGAADSVVTTDWNDVFRYSLGAIYRPTDQLDLRAGISYDETPVPDAEHRTPRIPDADRIWLTFGAGYQFSPLFEINFGYAHLFVDDPEINKQLSDPENTLRGALVGEYDASVDIFSVSMDLRF